MATKRKNELVVEDIPSKILKALNDESAFYNDVFLDSSLLSEDLKCSLEFDAILKMFVVGLEKKLKGDEKRSISFGVKELDNIIRLTPTLEKISSRYSAKRSPKILDIPFEMEKGEIGDLITVMSLKENLYKRGMFDVDIRKCVKKADSEYQYTSEGVRFKLSTLPELIEKLGLYQKKVSHIYVETFDVLKIALAYVIIREITVLSDNTLNCHGCQIQHNSQSQHMGPGGCLSTDQPEWGEIVDKFWSAARQLVDEDEVLRIATNAGSQLPELQVRPHTLVIIDLN